MPIAFDSGIMIVVSDPIERHQTIPELAVHPVWRGNGQITIDNFNRLQLYDCTMRLAAAVDFILDFAAEDRSVTLLIGLLFLLL